MRHVVLASILLLVLSSCQSSDRPTFEPKAPRLVASKQLTTGGPFLKITIPSCQGSNPAQVPPITTFQWQTIEGSVDPDSVRWILVNTAMFGSNYDETLDYIRTTPDAPEWYPWQPYEPSSDTLTRWTTPPTDFGRYVFAVHGTDADGPSEEFDWDRNAVRVLVGPRATGPIVRVTSDFMDPVLSASPNTPATVVNLPGGTPVSFCWTGDASNYCGVVVAYRYGWDVQDVADNSLWDVSFTASDGSETCSVPRTFFFGTHTFRVEVVDNGGFVTRIPIRINFTPPPLRPSLDIQPGPCPNRLNPRSKGGMWIALLGSAGFDARDVDISTLGLYEVTTGLERAIPARSKTKDASADPSGGLECACPSRAPDGIDDLLLRFRVPDVARVIGATGIGETAQLVLGGELRDGTPFMAVDCVQLVGFDGDEEEPTEDGPDTEIVQVINTYWVDGTAFTETVDVSDAQPDTVPHGSWVLVFYNGSPNPSDTSFCLDELNKCITYQKSFTQTSARFPGLFDATTPWLPYEPEDNNPFGTTDSTSMNIGGLEYTVRIRSVDEFDVPDATPALLPIVGNFEPTLDDVRIENHDGTVVGYGDSIVWDWWNPANYHGFIGDTLDIDPPNIWVVKDFFFLVKGTGHDHPKEGSTSGVKSWYYTFSRSDDPSFLQPFGRSGSWHDAAAINTVCDTVKLRVRYSFFEDPGGTMAWDNLPDWLHRSYDLKIRGRDTSSTDEFDQLMFVNGELTLINRYSIGTLGRETEEGTTRFGVTIVR